MSTELQADTLFQLLIHTFSDAFGIVNPQEIESQRREILPEFVQMDAVVVFPDDFDFTTLSDRIFPFLGQYDALEYKGENDPLTAWRFYQYSFTELGIITTYLLSKERKDRREREPLSQRAAREQWQRLSSQGAMHSCCTVIFSTTDPKGLRKAVGLEAVNDYPHLAGALYRKVISEDEFVGSIATYLVVLNHLPVHPKNPPLLLLSKGKKLTEFCRWLQKESEGMTMEDKLLYQYYLVKYNLIQDMEVLKEMKYNFTADQEDLDLVFELLELAPRDRQSFFLQKAYKRWLNINTPLEMAQNALKANSPLEVAQKALQANSPLEVAQKALQADSPVDGALKFIQSEEQRRELLERLQQTSYQTVTPTTGAAAGA